LLVLSFSSFKKLSIVSTPWNNQGCLTLSDFTLKSANLSANIEPFERLCSNRWGFHLKNHQKPVTQYTIDNFLKKLLFCVGQVVDGLPDQLEQSAVSSRLVPVHLASQWFWCGCWSTLNFHTLLIHSAPVQPLPLFSVHFTGLLSLHIVLTATLNLFQFVTAGNQPFTMQPLTLTLYFLLALFYVKFP